MCLVSLVINVDFFFFLLFYLWSKHISSYLWMLFPLFSSLLYVSATVSIPLSAVLKSMRYTVRRKRELTGSGHYNYSVRSLNNGAVVFSIYKKREGAAQKNSLYFWETDDHVSYSEMQKAHWTEYQTKVTHSRGTWMAQFGGASDSWLQGC